MTESTLQTHLSPAILRDVLQNAGYRVEETQGPRGEPSLRSATAGLTFDVHFANPLVGQAGVFADATFQAAFQVQGELPLALVNQWNVSRRFARLNLLQNLLLLNMDVIALGGVMPDHLRAQAEIWDHLVQQLIAYLREELPRLAKAAPVAEPLPAEAVDVCPASDAA